MNKHERSPSVEMIQEAFTALKGAAVEPLRLSRMTKDRLANPPGYEEFSRGKQRAIQFRAYVLGYFLIETNIATTAGLIVNHGDLKAGLIFGAATWMVQGAAMQHVGFDERNDSTPNE